MTHRVAVRMLGLVPVDAIANLARRKPGSTPSCSCQSASGGNRAFSQPMRARHRAIELNHRSARSRCTLRKSSSIVITGWRGGGVELVAPGSLPDRGSIADERKTGLIAFGRV